VSFSDPNQPLATCVSGDCDDCPVRKAVHCHFVPRDLLLFLLIALPSLAVGGAGVYLCDAWFLGPWFAMMLGFFGLVEIRVLCTHCPHYAEPGTTLRCWANHGSPKLWRYRPGRMSILEKFVFGAGLAAIWGYPVVFLLAGVKWPLLAVYGALTGSFFLMLRTFFCARCINFACPLNTVKEDVRKGFFQQNPTVGESWGEFQDISPTRKGGGSPR